MKSIIVKKGELPGKTVAVFAGIHGNEKAGILVVKKLVKDLQIVRGTVYFVFGNPKAILQNVRYTESNLNRDFIKLDSSKTYEQKRALSLMKILDSCDALLDLHAYSTRETKAIPFAICEPRCHKIINKLNIPYSVSNISRFQAGSTNGYMENQNKIGIVIELGSISRPLDFVDLGIEYALTFLEHFKVINKSAKLNHVNTQYLKVTSMYKKNSKNFKFTKQYNTFDKISKNEVIATDSSLLVSALKPGRIMFPNSNSPVGTDSFWLLN